MEYLVWITIIIFVGLVVWLIHQALNAPTMIGDENGKYYFEYKKK